MKLTVLTENVAGGRFLAEHGLSYLIEHQGEKILLDTGHSDVYLHNAELLGIDIHKEVDTVVLSHGHWDHGDGLQYLQDKILYCHPLSFMQRFRQLDKTYLGLKISKSEAIKRFDLQTSITPIEVKPNVFFLGEVPRLNDFEAQTTTFLDSNDKPDFVLDDSALAIVEDDALIIVTACSHSGICNIIEHAIKTTGVSKVKAVIGGLHLKHNDEVTRKTIDFLNTLNIQKLYPSHCTALDALAVFNHEFGVQQVKTGMIFEL